MQMDKSSSGVTEDLPVGEDGMMMMMQSLSGVPASMQYCLAQCDVDDVELPSQEECDAYAMYLHLPDLSRFQGKRLWPDWANEPLVRPALHSLEMVFRMISSVLCDQRTYIDKEEWLRRLEALANSQLELLSLICEGDSNAPATKQQQQQQQVGCSPATPGSWQKTGSRPAPVKCSQESLLRRMATWKKAQSLVTRLHFAIEGHMLRAPFTLGLGEPNLSGKPILDYDRICTPSEVYACLQNAPDCPEDHALATAHQIMESWLIIAQGLVKNIEERVDNSDTDGAANKSWILERVWKLFTGTMDLLQVMDPDDFLKLKQNLVVKPPAGGGGGEGKKRCSSAGAAFCLRSSMLRIVTKSCRELRSLVPKAVGVEVDPKGGPRLQEAIIELFNSHGKRSRGQPQVQSPSNRPGTIHFLQALQAIEVAIRQFYFTYRHLVITVMGSGEYTGSIQSESSGADALLQLYSEPPYFPSVDGARTFLGGILRHNAATSAEEAILAKQRRASKSSSIASGSGSGSVSSNNESEEDIAWSSTMHGHESANHPRPSGKPKVSQPPQPEPEVTPVFQYHKEYHFPTSHFVGTGRLSTQYDENSYDPGFDVHRRREPPPMHNSSYGPYNSICRG